MLAAGHQGWIGGTDHISTTSSTELHHLSCAGLGYWIYEAHGDCDRLKNLIKENEFSN